MHTKSILFISICVATLMLYYIIYVTAAIYGYSKSKDPHSADAAVILGAAAWHDRPSPVFRERINHGIWLYKQGYVKKLIFTGGKSINAPFSESSVAQKYAIAQMIPAEDIYIEEYSRTTYENILYAADIIKRYNFKTVILVSDPFHLKRAVAMARDNNIQATVYASPTPTTRYQTIKTMIPFLVREVFFYIVYEFETYYFHILMCAVIGLALALSKLRKK